ncbi:hypothetical protein EJB05_41355, partial [Eragrostis curvula]
MAGGSQLRGRLRFLWGEEAVVIEWLPCGHSCQRERERGKRRRGLEDAGWCRRGRVTTSEARGLPTVDAQGGACVAGRRWPGGASALTKENDDMTVAVRAGPAGLEWAASTLGWAAQVVSLPRVWKPP